MGRGINSPSPLDPRMQGQCIQLVFFCHGNLKVFIDKLFIVIEIEKKMFQECCLKECSPSNDPTIFYTHFIFSI